MTMALSYFQKLGLESEMVYSIFRAFLHLSIFGFLLQFIFTEENSGWILLAYSFMVPFPLCFLFTFLSLSENFLDYEHQIK